MCNGGIMAKPMKIIMGSYEDMNMKKMKKAMNNGVMWRK